jgi:hypothetical protein
MVKHNFAHKYLFIKGLFINVNKYLIHINYYGKTLVKGYTEM